MWAGATHLSYKYFEDDFFLCQENIIDPQILIIAKIDSVLVLAYDKYTLFALHGYNIP